MKIHDKQNRKFAQYIRGLLAGIFIGLVLSRFRLTNTSDDEQTILEKAGNPGYSPAAGYVMQLYREGKLLGEDSILRDKNLMGANWQKVLLFNANLSGICLEYADLTEASLYQANLSSAKFRSARMQKTILTSANIEKASFLRANLDGAFMYGAKAKGASFFMAKLRRSKMKSISLPHADLSEADLHGTQLQRADLSNTSLIDTNFSKANLDRAYLLGATMMNANLTDASIENTKFDTQTALPDSKWSHFKEGTRIPVFDKYWTPETDMTKYTNPNHPDFWQPDWVKKYDWVQRNYDED